MKRQHLSSLPTNRRKVRKKAGQQSPFKSTAMDSMQRHESYDRRKTKRSKVSKTKILPPEYSNTFNVFRISSCPTARAECRITIRCSHQLRVYGRDVPNSCSDSSFSTRLDDNRYTVDEYLHLLTSSTSNAQHFSR